MYRGGLSHLVVHALRHFNPAVQVQRCFTSTETVRIIRDGEHRTATSTFTLLLSSDVDLLNMRLLMEVEGQQPKWSICRIWAYL